MSSGKSVEKGRSKKKLTNPIFQKVGERRCSKYCLSNVPNLSLALDDPVINKVATLLRLV